MEQLYTLTKEERLSANKRIDALFASGQSFIAYPLRVVYIKRERNTIPISIMISVSKKKIKRAVKRNRVKRLVREAYRLNKSAYTSFAESSNASFDIAFLYLKNELPSFQEIEASIIKTIALLQEHER